MAQPAHGRCRSVCCRRCQAPLPRPGCGPWCRACKRILICTQCREVKPWARTRGWCKLCKAAYRLAGQINREGGKEQPDGATLKCNIANYAARAAQGLPLFGD